MVQKSDPGKESGTDSVRKFREVSDYYGRILESSKDLKTDACCTIEPPPDHVKAALTKIHPEVTSKYYGCGLVIPSSLNGQKVLDLGCGSGRDVYLLANLVGESGFVTGVDMTQEQLDVAKKHSNFHAQSFGFSQPNTEFILGNIENLDQIGIQSDFYDIVVSNCVINLSPEKEKVLTNVFRSLKSGGEMFFSDVYSDRRIPEELRNDPVMYGECLSGALYWNDFISLARQCGFSDPRLVENRPLTIQNKDIQNKLGNIQFQSATYRLFKLDHLDDGEEDYGQAVRYLGTTPHSPDEFQLDNGCRFLPGKISPVSRNTFSMLKDSRFHGDFEFFGDDRTHFGSFAGTSSVNPFAPAGSQASAASSDSSSSAPCC